MVVIAIMALMLGMFLLSTNVISRRACRQCAKQLKHEIDQVRIATMGKNKVTLHLYLSPGNKVMVQETTEIAKIGVNAGIETVTGEEREAGSSMVSVEVLASDGNTYSLNNSGVFFEFNRSTGAFRDVTGGQVGGNYTIKEISVSGGGLTEKLTLSGLTGKVTEN